MTTDKEICYCACCQKMLFQSDIDAGTVADHPVYKMGELSYIELAHNSCADQDNETRPDDGSCWRWTLGKAAV